MVNVSGDTPKGLDLADVDWSLLERPPKPMSTKAETTELPPDEIQETASHQQSVEAEGRGE